MGMVDEGVLNGGRIAGKEAACMEAGLALHRRFKPGSLHPTSVYATLILRVGKGLLEAGLSVNATKSIIRNHFNDAYLNALDASRFEFLNELFDATLTGGDLQTLEDVWSVSLMALEDGLGLPSDKAEEYLLALAQYVLKLQGLSNSEIRDVLEAHMYGIQFIAVEMKQRSRLQLH